MFCCRRKVPFWPDWHDILSWFQSGSYHSRTKRHCFCNKTWKKKYNQSKVVYYYFYYNYSIMFQHKGSFLLNCGSCTNSCNDISFHSCATVSFFLFFFQFSKDFILENGKFKQDFAHLELQIGMYHFRRKKIY